MSEAKKIIADTEEMGKATVAAGYLIKEHYHRTKEKAGTIKCSCGGELKYLIVGNGHMRAHCSKCGISFIE
jgi:hypothetical protein